MLSSVFFPEKPHKIKHLTGAIVRQIFYFMMKYIFWQHTCLPVLADVFGY